MMNLQQFDEFFLQNKSSAELIKTIHALRKEINRSKDIMEHPNYISNEESKEPIQMDYYRSYLNLAIVSLKENIDTYGSDELTASKCEYKPSPEEKRALIFEENLPALESIYFSIGSLQTGYQTHTFTFGGHRVLKRWSYLQRLN